MNRADFLAAMCDLATQVNEKVFEFSVPSDCVCGRGWDAADPNFLPTIDAQIVQFIQDAVIAHIDRTRG